MTPLDYDYLAQAAEGPLRPRPVGRQAVPGGEPADAAGPQGGRRDARRAGGEAQGQQRAPDRRRGRGDDHQRVVLLSRQGPVRAFHQRHHAERAGGARAGKARAHLVRGGLDRPGALFARDVPEGDEGQARRLARRDSRHRPLDRGAGEGQGRHLQPVRSAARPADPDAGEVLHPDRRHLADLARDPRHGAVQAAQSAGGLRPSRQFRRGVLPQRADLFRPGDQGRRAQPHRPDARVGRLPGARRGRDRGRPDRGVQADRRTSAASMRRTRTRSSPRPVSRSRWRRVRWRWSARAKDRSAPPGAWPPSRGSG